MMRLPNTLAARRRAARLLVAAAVALATITVAGCSPSPIKPLAQDAVILALGDSLTEGTGGSGVTYPDELAKIIGREVINAGIRGETSAGAMRRAQGLIERHNPQLIILCTGGNDFLRRQDSEQTRANITAIVKAAKAADIPIMLIAVPRFSPIALNHPIYDDIAGEEDLWLEDDILKTVLFDPSLKSDRVHPNGAGYKQIAEAVAALLKKSGAVE